MAQARTIHGIAVSPGLALGPVLVVRAEEHVVPAWSVAEGALDAEIARLRGALKLASEELQRRQALVAAQAGEKDAQIFAVHRTILADPRALREVEGAIRDERINAEAAVDKLIKRLERTLSKLEGDSVRSYAADLADPWRDVLNTLMKVQRQTFLGGDTPVILAAAVLTPEVMTCIERERLLGVITEAGGRFSHGAVLARSFGVPCVVGLPGLLGRLEQGLAVTIDGARGQVQLKPDAAQVQEFEAKRAGVAARQQALAEKAGLPALTRDGAPFGVFVNVESVRDFDTFDTNHADGIGLLRTEFMYMERSQFPSEEEQFRMYRRVVEQFAGRPVTLRTLDIGGDKKLPYFQTPSEANPALGWRGIRVSLEWQDLLRVQLRAALRAGAGGDLRILLPMVTSLEEIEATHTIFSSVKNGLLEQGYEVASDTPVGIMIEVPSVLLCLERLIKHVDFVSVGTNDLVQYLLAVDRDHPWVSRLYEPHHPAVIQALAWVARTARAAGKPCAVCGDMADDPAVAALLLGLGFDSVSVAANFLPEIKYALRQTTLVRARALASRALEQSTVDGVRRVLSEIRDELHAN